MTKPKIVAIVGPTASGKTSLSIELAQQLKNMEIISADSRQVYRGLDIGTGKVTKKEMMGVRHHLLDVANPKKQFSADDFVKLGQKAISGILKKTRIPIIVGGTGLYIDALLGRVNFPQVPPNPRLRAQLEKKSAAQLLTMLKKLDPERAKTIEQKNPRRLIRAIEVAKNIPPQNQPPRGEASGYTLEQKYDVLWLGLNPSPEKLKKNIHSRLLFRLSSKTGLRSGMITEAERLHKKSLSYKRMHELGLEYRYLSLLLQKKLTREQFEQELERAINQYAKRQWRWFKRNQDIHWVTSKSEALKIARKFLIEKQAAR